MIFSKLSLLNFGPYRSNQEYDLAPRVKYGSPRPIILFGGKNGAGKTTLLEAINLCLYGPSSLGAAVTKREYEQYLLEKMHKDGSSQGLDRTAVSLEFQYAHGGIQDEYYVSRSWKRRGAKIKEQLVIKKNEEQLRDLNLDQWNSFLRELIPPGIAQLFFFDGEKIRRISGDKQVDHAYLVDSIKSLLGIDVIERLRTDLVVYSRRHVSEDEGACLAKEIAELQTEKERLERRLTELRQDRAQLENKIERKKSEIQSADENVSAAGGEFYTKQDLLKSQLSQHNTDISQIENNIRELCHGLFPFSLCPDLCERLEKRLTSERKSTEWQSHKLLLAEHMSKLTEGLKSSTIHGSTKGLDPKSVKLFSNKIQSISQRIVQESDSKFEDDIVHDLSRGDIEKLLVWTGHVTGETPKEMARYCNRLLEAKEALARIEVDLARAPSEEIVKPLMNRLQELNQELGVLKEKAKRVDDEVTSMQSKLHQLEISMQKFNRVIEESKEASRRLKLVSRTQNVLTEFAHSLRDTKTKELENITSDLFRKLCRKRDLIDRVAIDSSDFSISIFDKSGSQIPKKSLSSGERQIFAISILWALRKVSARPIPVIIDTPLSRLDSDHRSKLINQYFPDASHQTIILSTDTEINKGYFEDLTTSISHTYHLHYYQDQHMTVGKPGYFWKRKKKAKYELK